MSGKGGAGGGDEIAVRAMTRDGSFRAIAVSMGLTARRAAERQRSSGHNAGALAELLVGSVLLRQTLAPGLRVQAIMRERRAGGLTLIADSHPGGLTRALSTHAEHPGALFELGPRTVLQVMRVLFNNELNQGIVLTDTAPDLGGVLTKYMLTSEQIAAQIEIAARIDDDGLPTRAVGYLIQLLPEAVPETIERLTERIEAREHLGELAARGPVDPRALIAELFADFDYVELDAESIAWGCTCSEVRMVAAMATLGEAEIAAIIEEGGVLDVTCDYCQTHYSLGAEILRTLQTKN